MERHANCHRTIGICIEYDFQFGVLHFETIITYLDGYQKTKDIAIMMAGLRND